MFRRTQEIGIRLALGAPRRRVFALVLTQGVRITGLGIATGVALALVVLRVMAGFLYGVAAGYGVREWRCWVKPPWVNAAMAVIVAWQSYVLFIRPR